MKNKLFVLFSFLLVGCAIEEKNNPVDEETTQEQSQEFTETFMLKVDPTYMPKDNDTDAEIYIIDPNNMEVYVQGTDRSYTKEELEMIEEMTDEELDEFFDDGPVEDSIRKIKTLKATREEIVISYDDVELIFTALSDSYFEIESGIRYKIEENTSISDYKSSLHVD